MRVSHFLLLLCVPCLALSSGFWASQGWAGDQDSADAKPAVTEPASSGERKPAIGLDSLLRPRGLGAKPVKRELPGGRDRDEWRKAFADVRNEIRTLEQSLEETRKAVSERSQGAYQYSPIGGASDAPSDPEVLKLRAQLRRDKKSLEAAESRLRELQVEASLSGVPDEWTRDPAAPRD